MIAWWRKRKAMRALLAQKHICFKHFRKHKGWVDCPCHCHDEYKEVVV